MISKLIIEHYPEIALQWENSNERDVSKLTAGSNMRGTWICEHVHTWKTAVCNQVSGTGCPVCSNKVVFAGFNDPATTEPQLAAEWDASNERRPSEVTNVMGHKIMWRCSSCDHTWLATIASRARSGAGCPACAQHSSDDQRLRARHLHPRSAAGDQVQRPVLAQRAVQESELPSGTNTLLVPSAGIRLVQVWEDDWEFRQHLVRRMLAELVSTRDGERARPTAARVVSCGPSQAKSFMGDNHLRGHVAGSVFTGLVIGGEIVAMPTLRRQNDDLALVRYATSMPVANALVMMLAYVARVSSA